MRTNPAAALAMLITACVLSACSTTSRDLSQADDKTLYEHAHALLRQVPLIDGHNDLPWNYRARCDNRIDGLPFDGDLGALDRPMHTDLARLRAGGVGGQFWSVYIPIRERGGQAGDARVVIEQIDFVKRLTDRYSDDMEMAYTADDVERIHAKGKIASLIGMEGGHSIENSMAVLRATYDLGARYMTITHSRNTDWADSATDDAEFEGLTEFGVEVIREMNRLGMLVDLSHVSADTMRDVLEVSLAPVIWSHSSAFAQCAHVRNVPDDVLARLPGLDGVVMVTFLGYYVSEDLRKHGEAAGAERDRLRALHGADEDAVRAGLDAWRAANPAPDATVAQVADHIDHVRNVAGIDHIGIGSDYDGTSSLPVGLEDVSTYPNLVVELLRRGYGDEDVRKILGKNVLRVMRKVEGVAADLRRTTPASETMHDPPGAAPTGMRAREWQSNVPPAAGAKYGAVAGKWEMTTDFRGTGIDAVMTLSVIDGGLSGSWESQGLVSELIAPGLNGDRLTFSRAVGEMMLEFDGRVSGDEITGRYTGGFGELDCRGYRAGRPRRKRRYSPASSPNTRLRRSKW